jgi:arginine decarboxylase
MGARAAKASLKTDATDTADRQAAKAALQANNGITETAVNPLTNAWSIEKSEELYRITGWGEPYFSINAAGHVTVSPEGDRGGSLDLFDLVNALKQRNLGLPLLIRFSDILEDRIERLNAAFAKANRPLQLSWRVSWCVPRQVQPAAALSRSARSVWQTSSVWLRGRVET